jgi:hypothetical protein
MEIPFPDVRRLCNECCIDVTMTCPVAAFLGPEQMKPKAKTATEAKAGKARQPTTNPSFLPGCKKAVVEAFNTRYPTMLLSTMIKWGNITLQDVTVGGKGECTSFGLLGRCPVLCAVPLQSHGMQPDGGTTGGNQCSHCKSNSDDSTRCSRVLTDDPGNESGRPRSVTLEHTQHPAACCGLTSLALSCPFMMGMATPHGTGLCQHAESSPQGTSCEAARPSECISAPSGVGHAKPSHRSSRTTTRHNEHPGLGTTKPHLRLSWSRVAERLGNRRPCSPQCHGRPWRIWIQEGPAGTTS